MSQSTQYSTWYDSMAYAMPEETRSSFPQATFTGSQVPQPTFVNAYQPSWAMPMPHYDIPASEFAPSIPLSETGHFRGAQHSTSTFLRRTDPRPTVASPVAMHPHASAVASTSRRDHDKVPHTLEAGRLPGGRDMPLTAQSMPFTVYVPPMPVAPTWHATSPPLPRHAAHSPPMHQMPSWVAAGPRGPTGDHRVITARSFPSPAPLPPSSFALASVERVPSLGRPQHYAPLERHAYHPSDPRDAAHARYGDPYPYMHDSSSRSTPVRDVGPQRQYPQQALHYPLQQPYPHDTLYETQSVRQSTRNSPQSVSTGSVPTYTAVLTPERERTPPGMSHPSSRSSTTPDSTQRSAEVGKRVKERLNAYSPPGSLDRLGVLTSFLQLPGTRVCFAKLLAHFRGRRVRASVTPYRLLQRRGVRGAQLMVHAYIGLPLKWKSCVEIMIRIARGINIPLPPTHGFMVTTTAATPAVVDACNMAAAFQMSKLGAMATLSALFVKNAIASFKGFIIMIDALVHPSVVVDPRLVMEAQSACSHCYVVSEAIVMLLKSIKAIHACCNDCETLATHAQNLKSPSTKPTNPTTNTSTSTSATITGVLGMPVPPGCAFLSFLVRPLSHVAADCGPMLADCSTLMQKWDLAVKRLQQKHDAVLHQQQQQHQQHGRPHISPPKAETRPPPVSPTYAVKSPPAPPPANPLMDRGAGMPQLNLRSNDNTGSPMLVPAPPATHIAPIQHVTSPPPGILPPGIMSPAAVSSGTGIIDGRAAKSLRVKVLKRRMQYHRVSRRERSSSDESGTSLTELWTNPSYPFESVSQGWEPTTSPEVDDEQAEGEGDEEGDGEAEGEGELDGESEREEEEVHFGSGEEALQERNEDIPHGSPFSFDVVEELSPPRHAQALISPGDDAIGTLDSNREAFALTSRSEGGTAKIQTRVHVPIAQAAPTIATTTQQQQVIEQQVAPPADVKQLHAFRSNRISLEEDVAPASPTKTQGDFSPIVSELLLPKAARSHEHAPEVRALSLQQQQKVEQTHANTADVQRDAPPEPVPERTVVVERRASDLSLLSQASSIGSGIGALSPLSSDESDAFSSRVNKSNAVRAEPAPAALPPHLRQQGTQKAPRGSSASLRRGAVNSSAWISDQPPPASAPPQPAVEVQAPVTEVAIEAQDTDGEDDVAMSVDADALSNDSRKLVRFAKGTIGMSSSDSGAADTVAAPPVTTMRMVPFVAPIPEAPVEEGEHRVDPAVVPPPPGLAPPPTKVVKTVSPYDVFNGPRRFKPRSLQAMRRDPLSRETLVSQTQSPSRPPWA